MNNDENLAGLRLLLRNELFADAVPILLAMTADAPSGSDNYELLAKAYYQKLRLNSDQRLRIASVAPRVQYPNQRRDREPFSNGRCARSPEHCWLRAIHRQGKSSSPCRTGLDTIEIVPERAKQLSEKFGSRINVINADFLSYRESVANPGQARLGHNASRSA